ncbi:hypothetical protein [Streptomyces aureocirculatus]|uniref:hypothetical protein n=1 Tax=Streptomyces aureocirculatus TaxID=67275 RepID=UPI0004C8DEED|nr:hypothetical protein [Streptomyces aureocirculatus]
MQASLKRRAAIVPAVAAAVLAAAPAAQAAQAGGSGGCAGGYAKYTSGGYAKYTSKGDHLYAKDRKADGRSVFINLDAASGKPHFWNTFHLKRGAGKHFTWKLNLPEKRKVRTTVSLVKGDPGSDSSKWYKCASFTSRT